MRTSHGMRGAHAIALIWSDGPGRCPAPPRMAQATGAIAGVVTDETGAVMPGVTVTSRTRRPNQSRTASPARTASTRVPLLPAGAVRGQGDAAPASRPSPASGITVTVESTPRVDMKLAVGGVEENVTVSTRGAAGRNLERHARASSSTRRRSSTCRSTAATSRSSGTLIPGVVAAPARLGGASGDATPGGFGNATAGFNVNGMRNQSNNFLLDGASNNDTFNTGFVLRPPPDAIQEFKILTHSYSAEYGRNAGSVVNVVTSVRQQRAATAPPGSSTATTRCRRATSSRRRTRPSRS